MREQIDTIPVNDAFLSGDECPFCYLERLSEQRTIRYTLGPGASYMEPDVRGVTDRQGFCKEHFKKMYDYGNALGNALVMQTYIAGLLLEFDQQIAGFETPAKRPLFAKKNAPVEETDMLRWAKDRQSTCFICNRVEYHMNRYFHTFFVMLKDEEFRSRVENSKGFCMRHFTQLMEKAQQELPNAQREWFYNTVVKLMRDNLVRVKEDLDWFVGMFDYRQAGADWKNSRDAVSRSMQKLRGLYPADPPYKMNP